MMCKKKYLFFFFLLLFFFSNSQNGQVVNTILKKNKKTNNLTEYYYSALDSFAKQKRQLDFFKKILNNSWREPKTIGEQEAKVHFLVNYAYYLQKQGSINRSIFFYEKAYFSYKSKPIVSYNIIGYCLKPLANNYTRIGDYKRAEELQKYIISLAEKQKNKDEIIAAYLNLSIVYQSIGKLNEAEELLKKAILLDTKNKKAILYSQLAKIQLQQNKLNLAIKTIQKSIDLDVNQKELSTNLQTLATIYFQQKNFVKAIKFLKKALNKTKNKRVQAKTWNKIAKIYRITNKPEKSILAYNKSLSILLPNYKSKLNIPVKNEMFPENTLKESLDGIAFGLIQKKEYKKALTYYELAFYVADLLQNTFTSQEAKLLLQQENRKRSEKTVLILDKLFQESKKDSLIYNMVQYIEKNKSSVLFNSLIKKKKFKKVKSDSLYVIQQKLIKAIAQIDAKIQVETQKNETASITKLQQLNQLKISNFSKLNAVESKLYVKYPFLDNNSTSDILNLVQNILASNQSIIYFFNTKEYLFVFNILKDKISYRKIVIDTDFSNKMNQFIQLFADGSSQKIDNNISGYKDLAFFLYKNLLKEELKNSSVNAITLIPDKFLNFIPFDALLTKKTTSNSYEKLPYLVKKYPINYGYSLSVLSLQKKIKNIKSKQKFIGFFPVFNNNHRNLKALPYTINEKEAIRKIVKGTFLENDKATKENFITKVKDYKIIHVSTHAKAGNFKNVPQIEFYDKTLLLPEIYGLNIQADLLVLSACETGIGAVTGGEGLMSLSRGFSYSGVKNMVVSLWKVNDKSTSFLMQYFYKFYIKNKSVSKALQQAKLKYLNNKQISMYKKNPYYWSGFVFTGNYTHPAIGINWLWVFIFCIGLFLTIFILLKRKKT